MPSNKPIPNWIKDIAFAVRDLIRQRGAERFREKVQQWATDRKNVPAEAPAHNLPLMRSINYFAGDSELVPKTLPEKYACLAAIHDGICLEAEPVDPWKHLPALSAETWAVVTPTWEHRAGFHSMVSQVENGDYCWEGCPWEESQRHEMQAVLDDVRAHLAKAPTDKEAGGNADFATAAGISNVPVAGGGSDGNTAMAGEMVTPAPLRGRQQQIQEMESIAPRLDTGNGEWVRNKVAANLEGVQTRTLADYRLDGDTSDDRMFGRDKDGRVWRRRGTVRSHPWYLKSTLKYEKAKYQKP